MIRDKDLSQEIHFLKRRIIYLEQLDRMNSVWKDIHEDEFHELQDEFKDVGEPQDMFNRYRELYSDDLR